MTKKRRAPVPNPVVRRTRQVNISFQEDVVERLAPPAQARGITVPDLVRQVVGEWLVSAESQKVAAS